MSQDKAAMSKDEKDELNAREAELLARHINTAFTTASSYGQHHPMAQKSVKTLLEGIVKIHGYLGAVTLLLDRGALFVEKHGVGQRFNPRRLINVLSKMHIESITFGRGVSDAEVGTLLNILSDQDQFPGVEAARAHLAEEKVEHIQLNYVVYRKVTADQKVVGTEQDGEDRDNFTMPTMVGSPDPSQDTFGSIAQLMSLGELVKDPEEYAGKVEEQNQDDFRRRQLVRQLRNLIGQVESGDLAAEDAMSSEEVLIAVNSLRDKVKKSYDNRKDVELILAEEDQVLGEIDQLTYSTLVSLVREEFRSGAFSASRMAQIINRMLPDARDLKRLLPQLKQGLLAEGMTPLEYGKLVRQLSTELRGEHLVKALEQGADSIGLDVDEIVDQIRDDPTEAARLIVMATELRRGGVADEQQLSTAFSDYIERVSEKLLAQSGPGEEASELVGDQLGRVQQLLIDQLNRQGLPPELISQLQEHLASKVKPESSTDSSAQAEETSVRSISLPSRVLNPANTAFFLKREIKSSQRYKTPFAVVKISIELLREPNGKTREVDDRELIKLMPEVYDLIINQMRDLDLVGSLDQSRRAVPLLILPMTEPDGAEIVQERLQKRLATRPFRLKSEPLQLLCAVSASAYEIANSEKTPDFFNRIQENHEKVREALHEQHTTADA